MKHGCWLCEPNFKIKAIICYAAKCLFQRPDKSYTINHVFQSFNMSISKGNSAFQSLRTDRTHQNQLLFPNVFIYLCNQYSTFSTKFWDVWEYITLKMCLQSTYQLLLYTRYIWHSNWPIPSNRYIHVFIHHYIKWEKLFKWVELCCIFKMKSG